MKLFTPAKLVQSLQAGIRRFPFSITWLALFTLFSILTHHEVVSEESYQFFYLYLTGTLALFSTVYTLWEEESPGKAAKAAVAVIGFGGIVASAFYFRSFWPLNMVEITAIIGIEAVLVIGIFLVSFFREKTDMPLWNFTRQAVAGILAGVGAGLLLVAGIQLLLEAFDFLFSWEVDWNYRFDINFICMFFVAPFIFLQFIPSGDNKHDHTDEGLPRLLLGVVRFVFVPLLFAYLLTLYIYGGKILLTWTLPVGWVSWLVSALMAVMLAVMILLLPARSNPEKRFDNLLLRWLPIAVLPLLLLMTVGIGRRISDYDFSVPRLYVLTFNLWCYAVCAYLIYNKSRRMWLVPLSFVVVLFVVSVGPWSFAHVVYRSFKTDVESAFKADGIKKFPITESDALAWLNKKPLSERNRLISQIHVLEDAYGKRGVKEWFTDEAWSGIRYRSYSLEKGVATATVNNIRFDAILPDTIHIPQGYRNMSQLRYETIPCSIDDRGVYHLRLTFNKNTLTFTLPQTQLEALEKQPSKQRRLVLNNGKALLMISDISIDRESKNNPETYISGLLFFN